MTLAHLLPQLRLHLVDAEADVPRWAKVAGRWAAALMRRPTYSRRLSALR